MKRTCLALAFAVLAAAAHVFAQEPAPDAARAKQIRDAAMIESVIADAREMKLPENRALVFSWAGTKIRRQDVKRARGLFENAVAELISAVAEADADRTSSRGISQNSSSNTRMQVLRTIAATDADFALDALYRSRPAQVERAMTFVDPKNRKIGDPPSNNNHLAHNELTLEHTIIKLAADQNPERAAELLRAALKKGISDEALPLLRTLHERSPDAAAEIGSEIMSRLASKRFRTSGTLDYPALQTSINFLNDSARERDAADTSFRFAAGDVRTLFDKVCDFVLAPENSEAGGYAGQLVILAGKLRPDAADRLTQIGKAMRRHGMRAYTQDPEVAKMLNGEMPVEDILARAGKVPIEQRGHIVQTAANRLAAERNFTRARQVIEENFSDDALTTARESLNWAYIHQLTSDGKYSEAEALISELPEASRMSGLISLAEAAFNRDQDENRSFATALLGRVSSGLPPRPENSTEMQQFLRLVSAFSRIEPSEAFRMLDRLIPQINDLADASAMLSGFQGTYNYRRGEQILSSGNNFGVHIDSSIFRELAQKDHERTLNLLGAFSRREMAVLLKQQLVD